MQRYNVVSLSLISHPVPDTQHTRVQATQEMIKIRILFFSLGFEFIEVQ